MTDASGTTPPSRSPADASADSETVSGCGQLDPDGMAAMEEKIRKVEIAISLTLRIGVILSVIVVAIGLGIMFSHHADYTSISGHFSYKALTSAHTVFPHSFGAMQHSIATGDGRGIVVFGILLLILTPILRVAIGVLSFIYEKDPAMTVVTLYVLIVLVGSFFLAGA